MRSRRYPLGSAAVTATACVLLARRPAPLSSWVQCRHQRSILGGPQGGGNWREKVQRHDRLREEQQQAEAAEHRRLSRLSSSGGARQAARRRQKTTAEGEFDFFRGESTREEREARAMSVSRGKGQHTTNTISNDEEEGHTDLVGSNPRAVPRYAFIRRWGLGRRNRSDCDNTSSSGVGGVSGTGARRMPLNPLHHLTSTKSEVDKLAANADGAHVSRLLIAVEELYGRSRRRGEEVAAQLSEDQKRDIVARYAETKWWGRAYAPFRNVQDRSVRRTLRICRIMLFLIVVIFVAAVLLLYKMELRMIGELSPEDRRDYVHMILGMRYGDIAAVADPLLAREDPLYALSNAARCHLLVEEGRRRDWHKIDWEIETRNRHPDSALTEGDKAHVLYWTCMTLGNMMFGGGAAIFNDNVFRFEEERARSHKEPAQQLEPTSKPESTRRSFFS